MRIASKRSALTTVGVVALSLLLAQLPNTSAPAVTYCIGPAAYPPDLPGCLDPVVEAKEESDRIANAVKKAAEEAALKAQEDKIKQEELANQIRQALQDAADAETTQRKFAELAAIAEAQANAAQEDRIKAKDEADKAKTAENEKRAKAEEIRKKADEAARNLAADQAAAAKRIADAEVQARALEIVLKEQQRLADAALKEFQRIQAELEAEIQEKKNAEAAALKAAQEAIQEAAQEAAKVSSLEKQKNDAVKEFETAKKNYENAIKVGASLKSKVFFINPDYDEALLTSNSEVILLTTDELKTILDQAEKNADEKQQELVKQTEIANNLATKQELAQTVLLKATAVRKQTEQPLLVAEENMTTASTRASTAQSQLSTKQTELLTAQGDKLKIEQTAKNLSASAAALEAQVTALEVARKAAEAQLIAITAQADALEKTKNILTKVADATESASNAATSALNQIQEATNQVEKASSEAGAASDVADKSASEVSLKVSKAADATAEAIKSAEESRIANENLARAATERAAAEAANKPKPISDKEYALLVAAAKKEAQEAALKQDAEQKAKAEADKAKKEQEAIYATEIENARKKAEDAKADAERLAEKAAAEIAAADARAAAEIEAAKERAQKLIDKIRDDLSKAAERAASNLGKFRKQATQSTEKAQIAKSVLSEANQVLIRANQRVVTVEKQLAKSADQVQTLESRLNSAESKENSLKTILKATENSIQIAITKYENLRAEITNYIATYNSAKSTADIAAKNFAEKQAQAARSKIIAENALDAYKIAAGAKKLISTEKPLMVQSAEIGFNLEMAANAADLSKLKQLADQAQDIYAKDKAAAEVAEKIAQKTRLAFDKVKSSLEAKVAAGKDLQAKIRILQVSINNQRESLTQILLNQDQLKKDIRKSQAQAVEIQSRLIKAKVEAQKANIVAKRAALQVKSFSEDINNANKVVNANELAVAAAKEAIVDVEASSNLIDRIVTSAKIDRSIKFFPIMATAILSTFALWIAIYAIIRRNRRRLHPLLESKSLDSSDLEIDFDEILAEIRLKQSKKNKANQHNR